MTERIQTQDDTAMPVFPPGRYGRRRSQRRTPRWVLVGLVAVVVAAGLGVSWAMYQLYKPSSVRGQVVAFTIDSDRQATIRFRVTKEPGTPATCDIRAKSEDHAEVARETVAIPAGEPDEQVIEITRVVPTDRLAVTVEVGNCREA